MIKPPPPVRHFVDDISRMADPRILLSMMPTGESVQIASGAVNWAPALRGATREEPLGSVHILTSGPKAQASEAKAR